MIFDFAVFNAKMKKKNNLQGIVYIIKYHLGLAMRNPDFVAWEQQVSK